MPLPKSLLSFSSSSSSSSSSAWHDCRRLLVVARGRVGKNSIPRVLPPREARPTTTTTTMMSWSSHSSSSFTIAADSVTAKDLSTLVVPIHATPIACPKPRMGRMRRSLHDGWLPNSVARTMARPSSLDGVDVARPPPPPPPPHHPNPTRNVNVASISAVTSRQTITTTTTTTSGDDDDGRQQQRVRKRGYLKPGMYDNCRSVSDLARTGHVRLDDMTPRDLSSFWTLVSRMMIAECNGTGVAASSSSSPATSRIIDLAGDVNRRLETMLNRTLERLCEFGPIPLAETALGFARISKCVRDGDGGRRGGGGAKDGCRHDHHLRGGGDLPLRDAFVDDSTRVFDELASASMHIMNDVDPRVLSNLAYSFGLAGVGGRIHVSFEDGEVRTILDVFADAAMTKLHAFNSQDLSNMLWAYLNVKLNNRDLFRMAGDVIVARNDMSAIRPQEISSILWSYASLDESHPALFDMIEGHILAHHRRDGPSSGESFGPRALSSVVSAYVISGEGRRRHRLFDVVADRIVSRGDDYLNEFAPRDLSNLMWAYATAGMYHPSLFDAVSVACARRRDDFNAHQAIANMLWAYASIGRAGEHMFVAWIPAVLSVLRGCDVRSLTSIAWAYAVANVDAPSLFGPDFLDICHERWAEIDVEGKRQLYQWHLWREELTSDIRLPSTLEGECYQAFLSTSPTMSALQGDVISELVASGLRPDCEVLTKRGYRIDAIVEVNGKMIGIEVDGPSHFAGRNLTGNAVLKRRHITGIEGISLVSVPYWEWNAVENNRGKRRQYLSVLLGQNR